PICLAVPVRGPQIAAGLCQLVHGLPARPIRLQRPLQLTLCADTRKTQNMSNNHTTTLYHQFYSTIAYYPCKSTCGKINVNIYFMNIFHEIRDRDLSDIAAGFSPVSCPCSKSATWKPFLPSATAEACKRPP